MAIGANEEDEQCHQTIKCGAASPSTSAASSTGEQEGTSEAHGMCLSSSSSGEDLTLEQASMANQKSGKRRRRRKRKRKKKNGNVGSPQELELIAAAGQTHSPSGESDEVISLASDFGRDLEEEVIRETGGDENANRTLWRVRRWATEMVSESETSSTSSDVELQSDFWEDGQRTPRWSTSAAHGSMSDFLWGMGCGENTGSSSSSSSNCTDGLGSGPTFSAERTVDYMHRLCCAEGQLMRSLANGPGSSTQQTDPRERPTNCPRCGADKLAGSRCPSCQAFAQRETSRWCGSSSGPSPISHIWSAASDLWQYSVDAVGDGIKRLALTDESSSTRRRSARQARHRRRHDGG